MLTIQRGHQATVAMAATAMAATVMATAMEAVMRGIPNRVVNFGHPVGRILARLISITTTQARGSSNKRRILILHHLARSTGVVGTSFQYWLLTGKLARNE
jgi:2-methylaconitate cis-trans-isomerase PrpF